MFVSEKKDFLKKNQCIHLATIAASLAVCHLSEASNTAGYASPMASFASAENCDYPVGYKIEDSFMEAGPGGSS